MEEIQSSFINVDFGSKSTGSILYHTSIAPRSVFGGSKNI